MTDARMPHDTAAEQCVLGSILIQNTLLDELAWLTPADFYHRGHQAIFAAMQRLHERGVEVDPITLRGDMGEEAATVSDLVDSIPDIRNAGRYAQIVREKARLRAVVSGAMNLIVAAQEAAGPDEIADQIAHLIERTEPTTSSTLSLRQMAMEGLKRFEARVANGSSLTGIPCGVASLDSITLGFQRRELAIVGARPSVGKTALGLQTVREAAGRGYKVLFVQLDMGKGSIQNRLLAIESGVPLWEIRTGMVKSQDDVARVAQAAARLAGGGDLFFKHEAANIRDVVAVARQYHRKLKGLDLVVVDHIGHIGGVRTDQRHLEVGDVSRRLMLMANDLDVAVLAMAQLNRDAADSEPTLATLRESGNLEQDARVVLLLDRPWWRGERVEDVGGIEHPIPPCRLNVVVAKNSEGESGERETLHFDLTKQRITPAGEATCKDCTGLQF